MLDVSIDHWLLPDGRSSKRNQNQVNGIISLEISIPSLLRHREGWIPSQNGATLRISVTLSCVFCSLHELYIAKTAYWSIFTGLLS